MKLIIDIPEEDYNNIEPYLNGETIKGGFNLFKALDIIKNGTPLEQEPKTGHWIGDNQAFYIYAKCSECGSVHDAKSQYCPTCGCLMEYEEETE